MPWAMIRPEGENAPEPLRFYIRDLTVDEFNDYQSRVMEHVRKMSEVELPAPPEDGATPEQVSSTLKMQAAAADAIASGIGIDMLSVQTFVSEIEGYSFDGDGEPQLPWYYLRPIAEKVQDFISAQQTRSWTLDIGTAAAKPSKGRK